MYIVRAAQIKCVGMNLQHQYSAALFLKSAPQPHHTSLSLAMATKNRIGRGPGLQKFDQEKITSLQIAGQKAFKAGEFQSALESFTQVRPGFVTLLK
jgi:hypothetical protein